MTLIGVDVIVLFGQRSFTLWRHMDTQRMEQAQEPTQIVGQSQQAAMMRIFARSASKTNSTVFLTGETGVGKDRLAEHIHALSERSGKFVPIVCGAIPKELMESELFGHERGSFTGAYETKIGLFEEASEGTLFINELDSMPLPLQVTLLRFTEGRSIRRLGSREEKTIQTRLIVGTNADPQKLIAKGEFRSDLWYRLNVLPYHVPALRERLEDIPVLSRYLLDRYESTKKFSLDALEAMQQHSWPGNIRELDNVVQRGIFFSMENEVISREHLRLDTPELPDSSAQGMAQLEPQDFLSDKVLSSGKFPTYSEWCNIYFPRLFQESGRNVAKAARIAGMKRVTLYNHVKRLGLKHLALREKK